MLIDHSPSSVYCMSPTIIKAWLKITLIEYHNCWDMSGSESVASRSKSPEEKEKQKANKLFVTNLDGNVAGCWA